MRLALSCRIIWIHALRYSDLITVKILLTGIAGFIGWRTAQVLLAAGHEVVGVDNLNDYYDPLLKIWRLRDLGLPAPHDGQQWLSSTRHEKLHFRLLDIEQLADVERVFESWSLDAVINLASRAGVRASMEDPFVYFRSNTNGTVHLLECMRKSGVKKFVMASTSSLYAGQALPFREDASVNTPISPYAASKKAAEAAAFTWHHLYGIDVSICRYFTVYGPAGRPDMAPLRFIHRIYRDQPVPLFGDGSQQRDFTFIDDIAQGTLLALKPVGYEVFNLGGGKEPLSMLGMIGHFERLLGKKARLQFLHAYKADMDVTSADISKAQALLGWEPHTDACSGFEQTVTWYLHHGSRLSCWD